MAEQKMCYFVHEQWAYAIAVLDFKPWLKVEHGCVPFPAVDKDGNTG